MIKGKDVYLYFICLFIALTFAFVGAFVASDSKFYYVNKRNEEVKKFVTDINSFFASSGFEFFTDGITSGNIDDLYVKAIKYPNVFIMDNFINIARGIYCRNYSDIPSINVGVYVIAKQNDVFAWDDSGSKWQTWYKFRSGECKVLR
ncbi:TPA: hypothetical protein PRY95_004113 [Escherichia coli]|nr:hypothetical protein [Escherichia coli]HDK2415558.1 hypothetical protein [Escherichia coli]HDK2821849.1 hypothetical protein [Escherichia coli]